MQQRIPNLRHLRAFEAVSRLGSVGRASAEIHVTQPAITQAIARLEAFAGATLLERRSTGSYPTAAGRILERRVSRFLAMTETALAQLYGAEGRDGRASAVVANITATQLRSLIAVSSPAQLELAAEEMQVMVPTLVRSARGLEQLLGVRMFRPAASGLRLNPAGAELARRMQLATREIGFALHDIAQSCGRGAGTLSLGLLPMSGCLAVASVVHQVVRRNPGCRIGIIESTYHRLLGALRTGEIDIIVGTVRRPDWAEGVTELPLYDDAFEVIVRHGHPLDGCRTVSAEDLARHEWVLPGKGSRRRTVLDAYFAANGLKPVCAVETSSVSVTRALVANSDRISALGRHVLDFDQRNNAFVVLPVDIGSASAKGLTLRADFLPTAIYADFIELIRAQAISDQRSGRFAPLHEASGSCA